MLVITYSAASQPFLSFLKGMPPQEKNKKVLAVRIYGTHWTCTIQQSLLMLLSDENNFFFPSFIWVTSWEHGRVARLFCRAAPSTSSYCSPGSQSMLFFPWVMQTGREECECSQMSPWQKPEKLRISLRCSSYYLLASLCMTVLSVVIWG